MDKEKYLETILNTDDSDIILEYLITVYKTNYSFYKKMENLYYNLVTALNIKKITEQSNNYINKIIYHKILADIELIRKEIIQNA